jgi:hypothetical protein
MHTFPQLLAVSRCFQGDWWYFALIEEWAAKREKLDVQLVDIPTLMTAYVGRLKAPDPIEPRIMTSDRSSEIRLSNACESLANLVYSMAEVAAQFGNLATRGGTGLPSSFNAVMKRVLAREVPTELTLALGDMQWYGRVREIRTEWAHFSTPFVGEGEGIPILVIRSHRRRSDKVFLTPDARVLVGDLLDWSRSALQTLDGFAGWLLDHVVVPMLPSDRTVIVFVRTASGFPQLTPQGGLVTRRLSVREMLSEIGVRPGRGH